MDACGKCKTTMVDGYLRTSMGRNDISVSLDKDIKVDIGKVKCSVCPNCGNIEFSLMSLDKLEKYL